MVRFASPVLIVAIGSVGTGCGAAKQGAEFGDTGGVATETDGLGGDDGLDGGSDGCQDRVEWIDAGGRLADAWDLSAPLPESFQWLRAADLDGDGIDELLTAGDHGVEYINVLWPKTRQTESLAIDRLSQVFSFEVTDRDGDGREEVVLPGRGGDLWWIVLRDGEVVVETQATEPPVTSYTEFLLEDLDGDGWDDGIRKETNVGNAAWSGVELAMGSSSGLGPWTMGTVDDAVRSDLGGGQVNISWTPSAQVAVSEATAGAERHVWWWMDVDQPTDPSRSSFAWRVPVAPGELPDFDRAAAIAVATTSRAPSVAIVPYGTEGKAGVVECCSDYETEPGPLRWLDLSTADADWTALAGSPDLERFDPGLERTGVEDVNGDGRADFYRSVSDSIYGPDPKVRLYLALGAEDGLSSIAQVHQVDQQMLGVAAASFDEEGSRGLAVLSRQCEQWPAQPE